MFRDEAKFLDEWISFHVNQGVSHFYLYNDDSTDGYVDVLEVWIARGLVTLRNTNGLSQEDTYLRFTEEFGNHHDWVAFIDIDEFLFAKLEKNSLPRELNRYKRYSGVVIFWILFGSSGIRSLEGKSVIKTLTNGLRFPKSKSEVRAVLNTWRNIKQDTVLTGNPVQFKSILRSDKVMKPGIHFAHELEGKNVDVNQKVVEPSLLQDQIKQGKYLPRQGRIVLYHYWSRSIEDMELKANKPGASQAKREGKRESLEQVLEWDTKISEHHNPTLANRKRGSQPRYIFFIGFNKSATTTIASFFQSNGYRSVHWDDNRLVEKMLNNIFEGKPVLQGYSERFVVFTDMIYASENEVIEGNHLFKRMESDYPNSLFILNNRDTKDWLSSRSNHGRGVYGYPRFLQMSKAALGGVSESLVLKFWTELKSSFESDVREHFKNSPNFLEIDIADPLAPKRISEFTGLKLDDSKWGHLNKGLGA